MADSVVVLDTSVLIDTLTGNRSALPAVSAALEDRRKILIPSLVLFEWLRGPRTPEDLDAQEKLFPAEDVIEFGFDEAAVSARLYRNLNRPRGREVDIGIAACAIVRRGELWTLNRADFADMPGLRLKVLRT